MKRFILVVALILAPLASLAEDIPLSRGQTLYLPIYSHLWYGDIKGKNPAQQHPLSILVSIRNTDPRRSIRVTSARYYDTQGKLVREYFSAPRTIPPLGTVELFVQRSDMRGGSGANFILNWHSVQPTNPPIVEGVHVDILGNRTLAFLTTARAINPD
jgi:hypothetical protein